MLQGVNEFQPSFPYFMADLGEIRRGKFYYNAVPQL